MISFTITHWGWLKKREVWFFNGEKIINSFYTVYIYAFKKPSDKAYELPIRKSVYLDLKTPEQKLFDNIHPTFQYDIQRGKKENFIVEVCFNPGINEINLLVDSYSDFARTKDILPLKKKWVMAASTTGNLCMTKVFVSNRMYIIHLYLFDDSHAVLTHSFNTGNLSDNTLRGYANKYLHWHDIMMFKEKGLLTYDFGGINPALEGISNFKLNFGGSERNYYQYIKANPFFQVVKKFYDEKYRLLHRFSQCFALLFV